MPITPIISSDRGKDANSNWVNHKTVEIHDGGHQHTFVSGSISLQSMRRSRFRLCFVEYEIRRLGRSHSSSMKMPQLHLYALEQNETKCLDAIRRRKATYLGSNNDITGEGQDHFSIPLWMPKAMDIASVVIVMQHEEYEPEVLIARGDFTMENSQGTPRDLEDFKLSQEVDAVTAVSSLNISQPLQESTLRDYASFAQSFMLKLGVPERSKIDYDAFKRGLDLMNVIMVDHRAQVLFSSCDEQNLGLLDIRDLELSLMVNDACPARSRVPDMYDTFRSYDVDDTGTLTFQQFQECLATPGLKSRNSIKDFGTLVYIFRKFADGDAIQFSSFVKLWSRYFADPKYEFERREMQDDVTMSRRMIEVAIPYLKNKRRKDCLVKLLRDSDFHATSKFVEVRKQIVRLRMESQATTDERRRSAKKLGRRQQRETAIDGSRRDKNNGKLLFHKRKQKMYLEKRRHAVKKIQDDCRMNSIKEKEAIILDREEKYAAAKEIIRKNFRDRLDFAEEGIKEVPRYLYEDRESKMKLMDLKVVDFSRNSLSSLPDTNFFFHLSSLRKLSLSGNDLHELPQEIESLKRLEILLLDGNELEELPLSIAHLESLKIIDISKNKLSGVPSNFCSLPELRIVTAHSNRFKVLSKDFGNLSKLESFDISNNKLDTIPSSLGSLGKLFKLNLANNRLCDLPHTFGDITCLEELDISCNGIQVCDICS